MPSGRRIIFSTYVVPTQIKEMEEDTITHEEFQANVNKTLGGKGEKINLLKISKLYVIVV